MTVRIRTFLSNPVAELSTWRFAGTLKDEKGSVIGSGSLNTLTLTIYNVSDLAIINSVNSVDILNTGRGVLDANGNLTITFLPDDNPIINDKMTSESRMALIEWTYASGAKAGKHEVLFIVSNLKGVS